MDMHEFARVVPFGRRYYAMALADRIAEAPTSELAAALRPESDFDRNELALWLPDVFHRIHAIVRGDNLY